tara:strand:- start:1679 stop:1840 length:162 start_codon:yes stop_codon:yes gene_type:complete
MTESEVIKQELESVNKLRDEVKKNLEDLTQHLGKLNILHNTFSDALKKDSSES